MGISGTREPYLSDWVEKGRFWVNRKTGKKLPIIQGGGGGSAAFDQDRFRFRYDDGDAANATWATASNNQNIVWPVGQNIRCRIAIQETAGIRATNQYMRLQYSINGGAYTYATPGSYAASTWFTDETRDNVQRLGTGQTFTGGGLNENVGTGTGDWLDFGGSDEYELEWCFRVPTSCVYGDTVDFRVYFTTGTALNTYTATPRITVAGSVKGNQWAIATGGGYPDSSIPAFMTGKERSGWVHSFAEGFRDGYSAKKAWMNVLSPRIHSYLYGVSGLKIVVVPFNAKTSTGTQDITSAALAGTTCRLALFFGCGTTVFDNATPDTRLFFGATDGTNQWLKYIYSQDLGGGPSGGDSTSWCAGFVTATGGNASFNAWITNGVQINWGTAAPSAYKCCAVLFGSPTPEGFQAAVGSWVSSSAPYPGEQVAMNIGWQPDAILFHCGLNASFGGGLAYWDETGALIQHCRGSDWDTSQYNVCGGWDCLDSIQSYRLETRQWKVRERDYSGFRIESEGGDTTQHDGHYVAFKLPGDYSICRERRRFGGYDPTVITVTTKGKPIVVLGITDPTAAICNDQYPYADYCDSMGWCAFDGTTQITLIGDMGASAAYEFKNNSIATAGTDLWYYDPNGTPTEYRKGVKTAQDYHSYTITYTLQSYETGTFVHFIFMYGLPYKSTQHAYMRAHWRRVNAYTRGKFTGSSSKHAFYNVVDAQDSRHCYCQGLQPSRSSKHGYMTGISSSVMVMIPFTTQAAATQDITSLELGGLTPKGAFCIITDISTDDTFTTGYQGWGVGFTDGTRSCYECVYTADDISMPYTFGERHGYGFGFACLTNGTGGIALKGTFNAWITNGIRVNWTTQKAGVKGVLLLFAGADASAYVGSFLPPTANNTLAITDPNFTPDLIFYIPGRASATEVSSYSQACNYVSGSAFALAANDGLRNAFNMGSVVSAGLCETHNCVTPETSGIVTHRGPLQGYYIDNTPQGGSIYDYTLTMHSYDAQGFTVKAGANFSPGSTNSGYLAVKLGPKLKALIDWIRVLPSHNSGKVTYKYARSTYNLMPEFLWLMVGHQSHQGKPVDTINGVTCIRGNDFNIAFSQGGALDVYGPSWSLATLSKRYGFATLSGAWFWDCNYVNWSDLVTARINNVSYNIRAYFTHPTDHTWKEHIRANLGAFSLNAIEIDWILNGPNKFDPEGGWTYPLDYYDFPILVVGAPEWKSSTKAYTKGQRVDWPNRTPRGCYLAGTEVTTDVKSDTPCYIFGQELVRSDAPAYINGFVVGGSAIPAYLFSAGDISTSGTAYLLGSINDLSDIPAYLIGSADAKEKQKAFLWGQSDGKTSVPAFIPSEIFVKSSVPAYMRNGTDVPGSFIHAYIWSDYKRSSTPAYMNGSLDHVKAGFILGGGVFPFTDDFTGTDGNDWNIIKWETDEH